MESMEYPLRLVVDGETFVVKEDTSQPGSYDYEWVTGPNPGYGFGERLAALHEPSEPSGRAWISRDRKPTRADHEEAIRDFLSQIDPATGYIEEDDQGN